LGSTSYPTSETTKGSKASEADSFIYEKLSKKINLTILIFTVLFTLGLNVFTIMLAAVIGSTFTVGLFSIFLFRSYTQELSKKINLAALTSYTGHGN